MIDDQNFFQIEVEAYDEEMSESFISRLKFKNLILPSIFHWKIQIRSCCFSFVRHKNTQSKTF